MPVEVRQKFAKAFNDDNKAAQWEVLSIGLGMLTADMGVNVRIAGDDAAVH